MAQKHDPAKTTAVFASSDTQRQYRAVRLSTVPSEINGYKILRYELTFRCVSAYRTEELAPHELGRDSSDKPLTMIGDLAPEVKIKAIFFPDTARFKETVDDMMDKQVVPGKQLGGYLRMLGINGKQTLKGEGADGTPRGADGKLLANPVLTASVFLVRGRGNFLSTNMFKTVISADLAEKMEAGADALDALDDMPDPGDSATDPAEGADALDSDPSIAPVDPPAADPASDGAAPTPGGGRKKRS